VAVQGRRGRAISGTTFDSTSVDKQSPAWDDGHVGRQAADCRAPAWSLVAPGLRGLSARACTGWSPVPGLHPGHPAAGGGLPASEPGLDAGAHDLCRWSLWPLSHVKVW